SSRHIRVEIDGVTVADSRQPRILFETGLPPRYYLPLTDLRLDLLRPSDAASHCPYKGTASYWSVNTGQAEHRDIVWMYRSPLPAARGPHRSSPAPAVPRGARGTTTHRPGRPGGPRCRRNPRRYRRDPAPPPRGHARYGRRPGPAWPAGRGCGARTPPAPPG